MRILHVTPTYLPATRYGGPIYSVHGLARAQARRRDDVHVFTTNVDGAGVSDVPLSTPVDIEGVKVWYFPCGLGRRLYRSPAMAQALLAQIDRFDVAHLHSAFLWPPLVSARMAAKRGVPYVFAPRGMLMPELIRAKSRLAKLLWIELVERRTIKHAAALHVTSDAERDGVERLGLMARRVAVIANGVELPPCFTARAPDRPAAILSLGRISWKKGLDRLIRALPYAQNADLIIAGNDDERLTPRLRTLANDIGVADRVQFLGPVEGDEKWRLIQSAAIFALASYSENFGNAVLEAMACARPVVITPEVGLAKIVSAVGAGVVSVGDPEIFGRAMAELLSNPARQSGCGAAGRAAVEKYFSWRGIAEEMDSLYKNLQAPH